jgi:hypothetical protein
MLKHDQFADRKICGRKKIIILNIKEYIILYYEYADIT